MSYEGEEDKPPTPGLPSLIDAIKLKTDDYLNDDSLVEQVQ